MLQPPAVPQLCRGRQGTVRSSARKECAGVRQGRDVPRREFGSTPSTSAIPTDGATRMRRVRKRASTTRLARSRGQGGPRVGGLQNWMAPESLLISETVSLLSELIDRFLSSQKRLFSPLLHVAFPTLTSFFFFFCLHGVRPAG